jgi:hypothetical protein
MERQVCRDEKRPDAARASAGLGNCLTSHSPATMLPSQGPQLYLLLSFAALRKEV